MSLPEASQSDFFPLSTYVVRVETPESPDYTASATDDYNRVVLDPRRDPDSPDATESDYINASYVDVSARKTRIVNRTSFANKKHEVPKICRFREGADKISKYHEHS